MEYIIITKLKVHFRRQEDSELSKNQPTRKTSELYHISLILSFLQTKQYECKSYKEKELIAFYNTTKPFFAPFVPFFFIYLSPT